MTLDGIKLNTAMDRLIKYRETNGQSYISVYDLGLNERLLSRLILELPDHCKGFHLQTAPVRSGNMFLNINGQSISVGLVKLSKC